MTVRLTPMLTATEDELAIIVVVVAVVTLAATSTCCGQRLRRVQLQRPLLLDRTVYPLFHTHRHTMVMIKATKQKQMLEKKSRENGNNQRETTKSNQDEGY